MVVNYKKGMIKSYFGDLEKDYTLDFVDETQFMGTGGGLCLLKGKVDSPFFFTNCDTLLDLDFGDLYEKHHERGNLITMVCALKHYTVPYGVVELGEDGGIAAMREKPELNFLTNTGVYVVEPRVVEEMRDGETIGFPDVIDRYRAAGKRSAFTPSTKAPGWIWARWRNWKKCAAAWKDTRKGKRNRAQGRRLPRRRILNATCR